MDFVSETGTYSPDWLSTTEDWLKGDDKKAWEDTSQGFRKKLDDMAKAGDVDPDIVSAFHRKPLSHTNWLFLRWHTVHSKDAAS